MDEESESSGVVLHNYLALVAAIVLYYDHVLTLSEEAAYIWRRPWTLGKSFFTLNRYFALVANTLAVYETFGNLSYRMCAGFQWEHEIALVASQIVVGVLMIMRVYVIYNRSRRVLAGLAASALLAVAAGVGLTLQGRTVIAGGLQGCQVVYPGRSALYLAGAWEACFAFDSLIFVMTVVKMWKVRPPPEKRVMSWQGVGMLFLRDGALYYASMALANAANILTFYFGQPLLKGSLSVFANTIAATMMSRLMLNIHSYVESRTLLEVGSHDIPLTVLSEYEPASSNRTASASRQSAMNLTKSTSIGDNLYK